MSWLASVMRGWSIYAVLAFGAGGALAQTEGLRLAPTGIAIADEATAVQTNPAGIGFLRAFQLFYVHERSLYPNRLADALFAGANLFKVVSVGPSLQWIRYPDQPRLLKTTLAFALGNESLGVGMGYNRFFSSDETWDGFSSFDAGLTFRPTSFLSLAITAHDLDRPRLSQVDIPRKFTFGIGLRPDANSQVGSSRWVLSSDFRIDDTHGLSQAVLGFSASYEPWDGLLMQAGLGTPLNGGPVSGQVAITLQSSHLGVTWAGGATEKASRWNQMVAVRLSGDRYPSISAGKHSFVIVDLAAQLSPQVSKLSLLFSKPSDPFSDLLTMLEQVKNDPHIDGVVLKIGELKDVGHARVEELHASLLRLRSQKRLVALFFGGGDQEYFLASTAERIYAVPQATFLVNGLSVSTTYFAQALSRVGVTVDVARVGAYKTFPDTWTRSDMSPQEREMLGEYLEHAFQQYSTAISRARGLSPEEFQEILKVGVLTAQKAQQAKLIDRVLYPDEVPNEIQKLTQREPAFIADYAGLPNRPLDWSSQPKIAVIPIEGIIAEGQSRSDVLGLTRIAGAQTILLSLEKALADKQIAAIVLRVDSGGGSGSASDLIWRAVWKAREIKPIVVSMGNFAASGGYYVSMAAHSIFADSSTVTGSIGVFAVKPNFGPLLEKVGIFQTTLRQGERADLFSLTRPWSSGELESVQNYVDEFYDQFITRVAENRNLDKSKVHQIAQGRIWSGDAAKEIGLVDHIGGLRDAIADAQKRAGIPVIPGQEIQVERFEEDGGMLNLPFVGAMANDSQLSRAAQSLAMPLGLSLLDLPNGPLALVPFQMTVE